METTLELLAEVHAGRRGPDPRTVTVTSVFWVHHGTRLAGGDTTYRNQYVLARVGDSFGACAFADGEIEPAVCADLSGLPVAELLDLPAPVRIATLDAYLACVTPHRTSTVERVTLPVGTPEVRANARDAAVAGLLPEVAGRKVALIGVVNPLVAAIRDRGAECLPCDLTLRTTRWGDPVTADMRDVLDVADAVVATGMTVGNGTFDEILDSCRHRGVPLVVYAQTGSAVVREFLGAGVTALAAEPFPFSQFSADETTLYAYRAWGSQWTNTSPTRSAGRPSSASTTGSPACASRP